MDDPAPPEKMDEWEQKAKTQNLGAEACAYLAHVAVPALIAKVRALDAEVDEKITGWLNELWERQALELERNRLAKELEETKVVRLGNEKMLMVNEKYLNKCWICGESADTCTKCASKAVEKAHTAAKGA